MKKLYYLLPILLLFFACSGESESETQEPDPVDTYAECLEVSNVSASNFTLSPEGLIRGHIIPDKQNKSVAVVDKLWPDATVNIVIDDAWAEIDLQDGINYKELLLQRFAEFEQITGLTIAVFEEENAPQDYVYLQHAFWNGSGIGNTGGKQYVSTGSYTLREEPHKFFHSLGHKFGAEDQDAREDRDEWYNIDFTNVTEGFGYFEINPDATYCLEPDYASLFQTQSEDVTDPVDPDAVTDIDGNDIPYITEMSDKDIELFQALYNLN